MSEYDMSEFETWLGGAASVARMKLQSIFADPEVTGVTNKELPDDQTMRGMCSRALWTFGFGYLSAKNPGPQIVGPRSAHRLPSVSLNALSGASTLTAADTEAYAPGHK